LKRKFWHRISQISIAFIILASVFILQFFSPRAIDLSMQRLDGLAYDLKISHLPPWPDSVTNIQIVDIDEQSLYDVGRMPWPRKHFADLTTKLFAAGALVVVYDILFSEPQINSAQQVLDELSILNRDLTPDEKSVLLRQFDDDRHFADAMSAGEVVLANLFHNNLSLKTGSLLEGSVEQSNLTHSSVLQAYSGYATVIPKLANLSAGQGFMNSTEEADGVVRRTSLVAELNGKYYPSLALEAYRVYSLAEQISIDWYQAGDYSLVKSISVGSTHFPTDSQAKIIIPFRGRARTYSYTSAAEVLNDKIIDSRFEQAVVFVGTSAVGLADLRTTPVELNFPGVEIQATVFDALMSPQSQPYRPDWWQGAIALELIALGMICVFIFPRIGPLVSIFFTLGCLTLVVLFNLMLWYFYFIDIPLIAPFFLVLALSVYFTSYGFFAESFRRKLVKTMFAQYVPPAHIDRLLEDPNAVTLDGERKQLSVLFSDIRSFTSISETMPAHELKLWLNQYFSPITRVILEHDGTIDKYVGDMVMAFWGAPLEDEYHAHKSIAAAFSMLTALEQQNQIFLKEGKPQVQVGIGINTGEMNVGDMGSDFRKNYTVIGDAVNLGARLEGLTKYYGVDILVSEFTRVQAKQFKYLLIDKVKVKGKVEPVTIYMPLGRNCEMSLNELVVEFNNALIHYYKADFVRAEQTLMELQPVFFNHRLIEIYLQRIAHFKLVPPAIDWDGSFSHTSK
jgi:adenylate cyclase